MGGRLAEELIFGPEHMTTGAGNDLERATELARKMVCEWGMSPGMGPLTFGKREESIFLGKEFARHQDYSESTAEKIDEEIRAFITAAYNGASVLLEQNQQTLEAIALALLEDEVLDGERIYDLLAEHSDIDVEVIKRQKRKTEAEATKSV
jgi:cell division protease FtsH